MEVEVDEIFGMKNRDYVNGKIRFCMLFLDVNMVLIFCREGLRKRLKMIYCLWLRDLIMFSEFVKLVYVVRKRKIMCWEIYNMGFI